ncbi:MAG: PspC domain-containing protein [Sphingobacteriales bacterium]|nr:MAG: PspC domain-containing protein [Sphingobacteriales bacterium]
MQRIIQITIAGQLISIEEDGYLLLKDYVSSLERHFDGEDGKYEIIHDIEARIAELFSIRLNAGAHAVDKSDVLKVIDTLGPASSLNDGRDAKGNPVSHFPTPYIQQNKQEYYQPSGRRLFRNTNDKMIGGVCSGVANYFDIDPVIVRLVFAILFLTAGIGLLAYILAWIIVPAARTPEDLRYMSGGEPMDFNTIKNNVGEELKDLKVRGEQMSRELRDFFSKKK